MANSTYYIDEPIARRAALKAYRTAIRLKYSLAADAEIARTLPEVTRMLDQVALHAMHFDVDVPASVALVFGEQSAPDVLAVMAERLQKTGSFDEEDAA